MEAKGSSLQTEEENHVAENWNQTTNVPILLSSAALRPADMLSEQLQTQTH